MAGNRSGLGGSGSSSKTGSRGGSKGGASKGPGKGPSGGAGRGPSGGPGGGSRKGPGRGSTRSPGAKGGGGAKGAGAGAGAAAGAAGGGLGAAAGKAAGNSGQGGAKLSTNPVTAQNPKPFKKAAKRLVDRARNKDKQQQGGGKRKAAGRALAGVGSRAAAAIATGGGSLVLELKMILIKVGVVLFLVAATFILLVVIGGMAGAQQQGDVRCTASAQGKQQIPANLMPIYESAARQQDHPKQRPLGDRGVWILAAINSVESDFGRNMNTSSAGAIGWMQFMPGTWAGYGVDADRDGKKDPYDPDDAIHAAAKLLRANGAPQNWYRAIFGYNHADWYVKLVEGRANAFQGTCTIAAEGGPVSIGNLNYNDTSGAWMGTMKFAKALAKLGQRYGCVPSSEKRSWRNTKKGTRSDHWTGSKDSYAVDIAGCSMAYPGGAADKTARDIAKAIGLKRHAGGCYSIVHGQYRFQLIWMTQCGGDHTDHVHIGVRRLIVRDLD